MKKLFITIMLITAIAGMLNVPVSDAFVFTETRSENPDIQYIRQTEDVRFVIRYTHSIHLSDVIETYEVTEDRRIRLVRMEYEDLAIGLPGHAEEGETFTVKDGSYILEYENRVLDSFVLFVANIDSDFEFRYAGRGYDLKELLERGTSYRFQLQKLSLLKLLKGVDMDGGG